AQTRLPGQGPGHDGGAVDVHPAARAGGDRAGRPEHPPDQRPAERLAGELPGGRRQAMTTPLRLFAAALVLAGAARPSAAAEVTSNGTGGGAWSDPATWRGNAVPGSGDDAVIARDDAVVFDRNDDGKVTCRQLLLDPAGKLTFKAGAGKVVMC